MNDNKLQGIERKALEALEACRDSSAVEKIRVGILGKKG